MKIRFLTEFKHADNGYTIVTYPAGAEFEVVASITDPLKQVSEGCAAAAMRTDSAEDPDAPNPGVKSLGGAPKNKAK